MTARKGWCLARSPSRWCTLELGEFAVRLRMSIEAAH